MLKKILLVVVIVSVLMMITGCGGKDEKKDAIVYEETPLSFTEPTISEEEDTVMVRIGSEAIGEGELERTVKYTQEGDEVKQTLVLEFTGVESYELIETIPKSFAASAKDLTFSVEPEILEDDPVVKWFIDQHTERIEITIKNNVKGSVTQAGIKAGIRAMYGGNGGKTIEEVVVEAGGDELLLSIIESVDDFTLLTNLHKCDKYTDEIQQQGCIFGLIKENPSLFTKEDCEGLDGFFYLQSMWANACRAMVTDNIMECFHMEQGKYQDKYENLCREEFTSFKNKNCADENCKYENCIAYGTTQCCAEFKDDTLNKRCLAQKTNNHIHCLDIKDDDVKESCCNEMTGSSKKQCLQGMEEIGEVEVIPEEQANDEDFRSRSSDCPYPVPNSAVWVEKGYTEEWAEGWQEAGKWVGEVKKYRNKEKTIYSSVVCYGKDGVKDGVEKSYNAEGQQLTSYSWVAGKAQGEWITYHANGQISSSSTYGPLGYEGPVINYFEDGSVQMEGQYKDGHQIGTFNFYNRDGTLSMEQEYDATGKQTLYKKY